MDENNIRNLRRILRPEDMAKVKKIRTFSGFDGDVADPWYTGDFETTYHDVVEGCKRLLK
jgi:protein-tyrosine phosphatase